jgi:tRNA threonylcarbamoyladenosine biosynthesis protein TsaB
MRIVAIDTTSEFGSLALIEARGSDRNRDGEGAAREPLAGARDSALFPNTEVVCEMPLYSKEGFSQILFPHLRELLDRNEWTLDAVDAFAAAAGPGSFTGVRVGLAAVKGLADALSKPVIGVSNLRALASFGSRALRAPVIDARRGQVFAAVYDAALDPVSPETVASLPDWLHSLPPGEIEFLSNFPDLELALDGTPFANAPVVPAPLALAGAVGRIATARLLAGAESSPAALDANYVRRSDAELFWRG